MVVFFYFKKIQVPFVKEVHEIYFHLKGTHQSNVELDQLHHSEV